MSWIRPLGITAALAIGCSTTSETAFSSSTTALAVTSASGVDDAALRNHVQSLVASHQAETPIISPYNIQAPHTHFKSAEYVQSQFSALGYVPTVEESNDFGMPLTNIYVDIPGTTPELVMLTGHHDAWFQSAADDNSSAIGILIEAARILKDSKPKRTIRIIAFDGEEEWLLGSTRYLARHPNEPIKVVLNMDCVAFASHEAGSQSAPTGLNLRDTGDFIAVIANERATEIVTRVLAMAPQLPKPVDALALITPGDGIWPGTANFLRSDHAPFWAAGIPALFFTDTADFRNPHYHTPDDLPDTLDYQFYGSTARLIIGSVAAFADSE